MVIGDRRLSPIRGLIASWLSLVAALPLLAEPATDAEEIRDARQEVYRDDRLQRHLPSGDALGTVVKSDAANDPEEKEADEETEADEEASTRDRSRDGDPITIDPDDTRRFFWLVVGALVLVIGFSFLRRHRRGWGGDDASEEVAAADDGASIDLELVETACGPVPPPPEDTIHGLLLRAIALLQNYDRFRPRPGLTAREILAAATLDDTGRDAFSTLVRGAELTRFGRAGKSADLLRASREAFARLDLSLASMADGR